MGPIWIPRSRRSKKVFGVISLTRAAACEKDKDAIAKLAIEYLREDMLRAKSSRSRRAEVTRPSR